MEYSKIASISVVNFMAYIKAELQFDEEGIINIKGYNHSGKSALLKGIVTCLMNYNPQKQAKYIHHGKDYFRIVVTFEDGTVIVRDKYASGQSLYEMYKNKELVFTTKVGNRLGRVDEVPPVIKQYLGLIETPQGYLNYQSRRDPLWLVETKGSDNYQDLNDILKTREIYRANALANSTVNKLSNEVSDIERERSQTEMLVDSLSGITQEFIMALSERELYVQGLLSRMEYLGRMVGLVDLLRGSKSVPEVDSISSGRVQALNQLESYISQLKDYWVLPEVDSVGVDKYSDVSSLVSLVELLRGSQVASPSVDSIDSSVCVSVENLRDLADSLLGVVKAMDTIEKAEKAAEIKKSEILSKAESEGIRFVECENCGTLMEVR